MHREYLSVSYGDRFEAKAAGAKWDVRARQWFADENTDMSRIEKFKQGRRIDPKQAEDAFLALAKDVGLQVSREGRHGLKANGEWQHVPVEGGAQYERNGAYRLTIEAHRAHGYLHNHKTGQRAPFSFGVDRAEFRPLDAAALHARREAEEKAQEARDRDAASKAREYLSGLEAASSHPYAEAKGIGELRRSGVLQSPSGRDLVIPLVDAVSCVRGQHPEVWSFQRITPRGDGAGFAKLYATGARKKGLVAFVGHGEGDGRIRVAEGWATASSIALAVDSKVLAAMDAGNIPVVVEALIKAGVPASRIDACPDDDEVTAEKIASRVNSNPAVQSLGIGPVAAADVDLQSGSIVLTAKEPGARVGAQMTVDRDGEGHVLSARVEVEGEGGAPAVVVITNAGRVAGEKARALGASVSYPPLTPVERAQGLTDFNDVACARGLGAVRAALHRDPVERGEGVGDGRFAKPSQRQRTLGR